MRPQLIKRWKMIKGKVIIYLSNGMNAIHPFDNIKDVSSLINGFMTKLLKQYSDVESWDILELEVKKK